MIAQTHDAPPPPSDTQRAQRAIDGIGAHDRDRDYIFDIDLHAQSLNGDASALRQILTSDPVVRKLQQQYRRYDEEANQARADFTFYASLISLVLISAVMLAIFLNAVPPGGELAVRAALSLAAAIVGVTAASHWPRIAKLQKKLGVGYWIVWAILVAGIATAAYCFVIPADFTNVIKPLLSTIYFVLLAGAVAADLVSGGMTARLFQLVRRHGSRGLHTAWYEARGHAEANRRLLFMAVFKAAAPADRLAATSGDVSLLSQKLEYFRRYQIAVQQSYYEDKSEVNKEGAQRAVHARLGTYAAFLVLFTIVGITYLARLGEQGTQLLPDGMSGVIVSFIQHGGDDVALLLALFVLGTYIYLQIQTNLLRETVNHRRFGNMWAELRQATSPNPGIADLANPSPLADARKAALSGDQDQVEHFFRNVNRLLASEVSDWNAMTPFVIAANGVPAKTRLFTADKLTSADFDQIVTDLQGYDAEVSRARKIGFVAANEVTQVTEVVTFLNGKESHDTAKPGDWIVTNMTADQQIFRDKQQRENTYVIRKERFKDLYDRTSGSNAFGTIFRAKGIVDAVQFSAGFDIVAPWGERQQSASGYLVRNGSDIYGIHADAFKTTYETVPASGRSA